MSDCLIQAEAVVAGWTQPATPPVSFSLQAGEVVGLAGPNGAGKSTLLAALAGRARRFAGALTLRPGLRLALQTQDVPPVAGLPVSGVDLFRLTGGDPAGPAGLAGGSPTPAPRPPVRRPAPLPGPVGHPASAGRRGHAR